MVSTLKLTKIQIPNSDSDVISLDASTGNITLNKTLGGTSITVQGEGTATTNLQQGLAKVRYSFDLHSSENAFEGSFNSASGTDNGTGDATVTFTNAMADQNYTPTSSSSDGDICSTQADRTDGNGSRQTTNFKSRIRDTGATARDAIAYVALFGDLA